MNRISHWVLFVSSRFGSVDARGRSAVTSLLATSGIAFGVLALIVILSVMNGFQMGYIDSILEVHSSHVRLKGSADELERIRSDPAVRSLIVFTETQALVQGRYSRQSGALVRGVQADILAADSGFASAITTVAGDFDVRLDGTVVLGSELARELGVAVGNEITLVAVSGTSDTDLFPSDSRLTVVGVMKTGYYEIDSTFAYVSRATGKALSGFSGKELAGVKLVNRERDAPFLARVAAAEPNVEAESWRSFNRAFFGALRVEKNMLFFLVILIFLVVTVNIYNSMRRSVYERREEIGVMSALGSTPAEIRYIFIANGLVIGLSGGLGGLLLGLLVSVRINDVFALAERAVNGVEAFVSSLGVASSGGEFSLFSPEYFYLDSVPVRIFFPEVLFVFLFGVLSATIASWMACNALLRLKPAEVLRYE